jgi:hypothetical protein
MSSTAPTNAAPSSSERPHLLHRLAGVVKRNPVKSIAFTYLAVGTAYYLSQRDTDDDDDDDEYYNHKHLQGGTTTTTTRDNNNNNDDTGGDATNPMPTKTKKSKVLVLPFYRMKLVEKLDSKAVAMRRLESLFGSSEDKDTAPIEMQVDELVSLIHKAADDPSIVGLVRAFVGVAAEIGFLVLLLFRETADYSLVYVF